MLRNVYQLMQRYIHFVNNNNKMATVLPGFDVLFKVRFPIDELMKGIWQCKVADKDVTIDKNMILYMGRVVSFVQYMPVKPIKHRLKVYALCCAVSAVLLVYQVYVGKEDDMDNSTVAICHRLCKQSGITGEQCCVLYCVTQFRGMRTSSCNATSILQIIATKRQLGSLVLVSSSKLDFQWTR